MNRAYTHCRRPPGALAFGIVYGLCGYEALWDSCHGFGLVASLGDNYPGIYERNYEEIVAFLAIFPKLHRSRQALHRCLFPRSSFKHILRAIYRRPYSPRITGCYSDICERV